MADRTLGQVIRISMTSLKNIVEPHRRAAASAVHEEYSFRLIRFLARRTTASRPGSDFKSSDVRACRTVGAFGNKHRLHDGGDWSLNTCEVRPARAGAVRRRFLSEVMEIRMT
jgi:hypothetical protein